MSDLVAPLFYKTDCYVIMGNGSIYITKSSWGSFTNYVDKFFGII